MKSTYYIKSGIVSLALYSFTALAIVVGQTSMAHAEVAPTTVVQVEHAIQGQFVQKSKRLKGNYKIVQENGQTIIRFSDNFKTVNGPDLKVFLSPNTIENASGQNATDGAVLLGFVKSKKGTQDYVLPAGVTLGDFSSVLIHCEAFSVLWGGGNI